MKPARFLRMAKFSSNALLIYVSGQTLSLFLEVGVGPLLSLLFPL